VFDERQARNVMKDLGPLRFHAGSLAGGQDDNVQVGHRDEIKQKIAGNCSGGEAGLRTLPTALL
jgi:hypothetical protein